MKLLIPVKRVIDYNVKVRIKPDHSNVDLMHVKMSMNPFDEIAVEEAVRLKEQGKVDELIAVSIGSDKAQETLRTALALGVDKAILIKTDAEQEPLHVAKILHKLVIDQTIDLVIMGKQSIDGDHNQTGQMLAALLNWPQATFASKVLVEDKTAQVTREIDGGLETINLSLPAVITTDLRLNEPRYATLPNIMKAKRKPLEVTPLEQLGLTLKPHVELLQVESPPQRQAGEILETVAELIHKLKEEKGVI